jgi:hypothetical protein
MRKDASNWGGLYEHLPFLPEWLGRSSGPAGRRALTKPFAGAPVYLLLPVHSTSPRAAALWDSHSSGDIFIRAFVLGRCIRGAGSVLTLRTAAAARSRSVDCPGSFSAYLSGFIEHREGFIETPLGAIPAKPAAPAVDIAQIVSQLLSEAEGQGIVREFDRAVIRRVRCLQGSRDFAEGEVDHFFIASHWPPPAA